MTPTNSAERRILARGTVSSIELCGCDGIHLTIGAVTVRLPPGAFRDLADTLGAAMRQLEFITATASDSPRH